MNALNDVLIKRKLMIIIMLVSAAALFLACAAFIVYDQFKFRKSMIAEIVAAAEMVGLNSDVGVSFHDPEDVEEVLESLKLMPNVLAACVYGKDGDVFASYVRENPPAAVQFPRFQSDSHAFREEHLDVFQSVQVDPETEVRVYVRSDLIEMKSRLRNFAAIGLIVFLASGLVAFALSARLQRIISAPIAHLSGVANDVALHRNYSARAQKAGDDELGRLIDCFNEMLEQIQKSDLALQQARDDLERRVEERTAALVTRTNQQAAVAELSRRSLEEPDLTPFMNKAIETAAKTLEVEFCNIIEWLPETRELILRAELGFEKAAVGRSRIPSDNSSLAGYALQCKTPVATEDLNRETRFAGSAILKDHGVRGALCVLIGKPENPYGIFGVFSSAPRRFEQNEIHFMQAVSSVVGASMERDRAARELEAAHKEVVDASRLAGMAEVANGVLHNVGNVLNSVNVSTTLVHDLIRNSKVDKLAMATDLFKASPDEFADFVSKDPRGRRVPDYLKKLALVLKEENQTLRSELESLRRNIEHIKEIISMQQSYGKVSGAFEPLNAVEIIEDALRMNSNSFQRHDIEVVRDFQDVPRVFAQKHKCLQILTNLMNNAKHALDESRNATKRLRLHVGRASDEQAEIVVEDNGVGILPEHLERLFTHGFTTKKNGHGFGLHNSALAARDLGGRLTAHSEGRERGAVFTLLLPFYHVFDKSSL